MVPRIPMVPPKAPAVRVVGLMAGLLVWGAKKRHIKKRETWCIGLRWPPLVATHNNQPIVGGSGRGDV